ncbi:MAG: hypothetical protein COB67_12220 [SAR324 cluster bacterium]|uniref:HAD family hydrolase n=1 Tax=SAR324 cluster bacterium TaxID=2024889 RepID=A0A2A4SRD5_9DELT|nr:MAG: hypothetical protein COB67_12220 [SAR324 cluster bacterium]
MIKIRDITLHIFDLDDTLTNTRATYKAAQKAALQHVFPELKDETFQEAFDHLSWLCKTFGSGNSTLYFDAFLRSQCCYSSQRLQALLEKYQEYFWGNLGTIQGAQAYLEDLESQSTPLALVSNGKVASQDRKLKTIGMDHFFQQEQRYISEEYDSTQKKPSPHMMSLACQNFGIQPEDAIYYGNTIEDILSGNLAGVATVFVGDYQGKNPFNVKIAYPTYTLQHWEAPFIYFEH